MSESLEEAGARYVRALHAMQSGVQFEHSGGSQDGTPKHLRVGVNSAFVNAEAVARLLVEKGIITWEENATAQADAMEREVARYQERARAQGYDITFG